MNRRPVPAPAAEPWPAHFERPPKVAPRKPLTDREIARRAEIRHDYCVEHELCGARRLPVEVAR